MSCSQLSCTRGCKCCSCSPENLCCGPVASPRVCGTPSLCSLQQLLQERLRTPNQEDEVWPNLYLGNSYAGMDTDNLQRLGITHILNTAHDTGEVCTNAYFYRCMPITYYGLKIFDERTFDISRFFYPAAKFIDQALRTPGGKVLVHCCPTGLGRGSTLVLAYLMIHWNMTLLEAICSVSSRRPIFPNEGFLQELRILDMQL